MSAWQSLHYAADGIVTTAIETPRFSTIASIHTVRGIILGRHRRLSDDEMLGRLKAILEQRGRISGTLIDESEDIPSTAAYRTRFGSLLKAYTEIGYTPERDYGFLEVNKQHRRLLVQLLDDVVQSLGGTDARVERDPDTDLLTLNGQFRVSLVLSRYELTPSGCARWTVRLNPELNPDLTIAVRLGASNETPLDYYLLPSLDVHARRLRLAEGNFFGIETYRHDTLDYFMGMAEQVPFEVAA